MALDLVKDTSGWKEYWPSLGIKILKIQVLLELLINHIFLLANFGHVVELLVSGHSGARVTFQQIIYLFASTELGRAKLTQRPALE